MRIPVKCPYCSRGTTDDGAGKFIRHFFTDGKDADLCVGSGRFVADPFVSELKNEGV